MCKRNSLNIGVMVADVVQNVSLVQYLVKCAIIECAIIMVGIFYKKCVLKTFLEGQRTLTCHNSHLVFFHVMLVCLFVLIFLHE